MPCIKPKPAWQSAMPNENGKHELRFKMRKESPDYWIPCGKCEGCTASKALTWAIRIYHEAQMHDRNSFITLTYADAPEAINRHDPQKFIKRLRRRSDTPIRYFLTGEYGEKTHRPHYHAIIFGEDFLGGAYDIDDSMYSNPILEQAWGHGNCSVSELTLASAMYTAGYTAKKVNDTDTFSIMSRNPPIGREWVCRNHDNLRRLEKVTIQGREFPIPAVYLNWLEGVEEYEHIKQNRQKNAVRKTDKALNANQKYYQHKLKNRNQTI